MHSHSEVLVHMSFGRTPLSPPHLLLVLEDTGAREMDVEILSGAGRIC